MKKYNPNFSDPRIQKRINRSLDYAFANLSTTKETQWAKTQIDRWFGQSQNPLSAMIRSELLICSNPYYNPEAGVAKKYLLNATGAAKLCSLVGRKFIPCALHLKMEKFTSADTLYGKTIESGDFQYKLKSNRMWNDIQNLDNATRKPLFANYGYIHEYDIRSAAPTILYQYAKSLGDFRHPLTHLQQYLKDPNQYRQNLSNAIDSDPKTAKRLITSRFAGARFGNSNSIIRELGYNWHQYNRLKANPWFQDLSEEIVQLWKHIKTNTTAGRLTARNKWDIYFSQELRVMRSVHRYMDKLRIKYFHEHDGWRCDTPIDLRELKLHIQKQTGYWIEFDWEVFELDRY